MTNRITLTTAALLSAAALIPAGLAAQNNCKYREDIELGEAARASLKVDAGAGKLVIRGSDGTNEVRVEATLCASHEDRLRALDVTLEDGRLDTDYPRRGGGWFGGNRYARIDLVVMVPAGTNLRVDDSSGSVEITGVGDVNISDGSGSMTIRGVGTVAIEDGSGSLRIEDVAGDVTVEDGSGSVRIDNVTGTVTVEDGSGSVRIRTVGGDVRVTDGSGSTDVSAVGGTVRVAGGGGSITVRDVDGDLIVTDTRRSRIRYSDIRGKLDLPAERRKGRSG